MNLTPLADCVILTRQMEDDTTASGLYVGNARETSNYATVVATGPGKINDEGITIPLRVSVGDTVLIGKRVGSIVHFDGEDLIFVSEQDILAIVG